MVVEKFYKGINSIINSCFFVEKMYNKEVKRGGSMRNYIRYIVILILIIAGGLLLISVINKFTEPDVSKVDNSNKTEEKETTQKEEENTDNEQEQTSSEDGSKDQNAANENSTQTVTTPNTSTVEVPNTATGEKTEGTTENIPTYSEYKGQLIISEEER